MHEKRPRTGCIEISEHAKLRTMQRLGVVERAANHLRDLLDRAVPVDTERVEGGQAWRVGNVYIVTDGDAEVVQTVFTTEAGR